MKHSAPLASLSSASVRASRPVYLVLLANVVAHPVVQYGALLVMKAIHLKWRGEKTWKRPVHKLCEPQIRLEEDNFNRVSTESTPLLLPQPMPQPQLQPEPQVENTV
jgi:hypothetical protein